MGTASASVGLELPAVRIQLVRIKGRSHVRASLSAEACRPPLKLGSRFGPGPGLGHRCLVVTSSACSAMPADVEVGVSAGAWVGPLRSATSFVTSEPGRPLRSATSLA